MTGKGQGILRTFQVARAEALSELLGLLERHRDGRVVYAARVKERAAARREIPRVDRPAKREVTRADLVRRLLPDLPEPLPAAEEDALPAMREEKLPPPVAVARDELRPAPSPAARQDLPPAPIPVARNEVREPPIPVAGGEVREPPIPVARNEVREPPIPVARDEVRELPIPVARNEVREPPIPVARAEVRQQPVPATREVEGILAAGSARPLADAPEPPQSELPPAETPPASAPSPAAVGAAGGAAGVGDFSRYVLGETIGEDGSERCFRAFDRAAGVNLVVVTHGVDDDRSAAAAEQIGAWAEAMREVAHPCLPRVTDWGRAEGMVYYAVATDAPATLESLLQREERLPFTQVLRILGSVAEALNRLHHDGTPHGDLTPNRILVREDGSGAAVIGGGLGDVLRGGALGRSWERSAAYLAPELWGSAEAAEERADQYALAVIAHEMITGRRRSSFDTQARVLTVDPIDVPPSVPLRPECPLHVNAAITRALGARPSMRFPTCGEFIGALVGDIALDAPEEKSRAGVWGWFARQGKRNDQAVRGRASDERRF